MVEVVYTMLTRTTAGEWWEAKTVRKAYFPNHRIAMFIMALWSRGDFRYALRAMSNVPNDRTKWHPSCENHPGLW